MVATIRVLQTARIERASDRTGRLSYRFADRSGWTEQWAFLTKSQLIDLVHAIALSFKRRVRCTVALVTVHGNADSGELILAIDGGSKIRLSALASERLVSDLARLAEIL